MTTDAAYKAWETRRANGWVHPNARDIVEDAKPKTKTAKATPVKKKAAALKAAVRQGTAGRASGYGKKAVVKKATKAKRRRA